MMEREEAIESSLAQRRTAASSLPKLKELKESRGAPDDQFDVAHHQLDHDCVSHLFVQQ